MGSGKTTVAEKVCSLNGFSLVDLDERIEDKESRKISEIFASDGEEYFRTIESKLLKDNLVYEKQVVSTGGGIVLQEENRELLKESGTVFWLYATATTIFERIKDDKNRPLINTNKSKEEIIQKIESMMSARFELYKDTADVIINTDRLSPEECADEILKEYKLLT